MKRNRWTALLAAAALAIQCIGLTAFAAETSAAASAEEESIASAWARLSAEAEDITLPGDLEEAKELVKEIQTIADDNRSALKDAGEDIDEVTFSLYYAGAQLSLELIDYLTEEEMTENNNPYGLCCNYVADSYRDGTGVSEDADLASEWYAYAVYTFQCSRSAYSYAEHLYGLEEYADAYDAYEYAWEKFGHQKSLRMLGKYYEYGYGDLYEIDCDVAEYYYALGAENGDGTSYARWANLYARQKMGKGKPANFRYQAWDILIAGVYSILGADYTDHEAVAAAVAEASEASVDDMLFLMGYVYEMGFESKDGTIVQEADYEEALFWYSLMSGESHELGYDFDASVERVEGKIDGTWVEWDSSFGGVDKMLDTELIENREELTAQFIIGLEYAYDGGSFLYNVYLPDDYDASKSYPVVLFLHDGSIDSDSDVTAPMMQGWGATIWTTEEAQAQEEVIVIAPTGYDRDQIVPFMDYIKTQYSIDENRVYLTGQSAGCITAYEVNAEYPDYFTATMYVSGQAGDDVPLLEDISEEYADQTWIFICAEGDASAYPGIQVIMEKLNEQGAEYGITYFSAADDLAVQNAHADALLDQGYERNIIVFDERTVTWYNLPMIFPDATPTTPEHMYAFDAAYRLESAREWLLAQSK